MDTDACIHSFTIHVKLLLTKCLFEPSLSSKLVTFHKKRIINGVFPNKKINKIKASSDEGLVSSSEKQLRKTNNIS